MIFAVEQNGEVNRMRLIDADELYMYLEKRKYYEKDRNHAYLKGVRDCMKDVAARPTIKLDSKWIPCSERLPEEKDTGILKKLGTNKRSDHVIATVEVKGERMTVTACTYDGKWYWNMKHAFPDFKVVAWMPLPEPYREDTDE